MDRCASDTAKFSKLETLLSPAREFQAEIELNHGRFLLRQSTLVDLLLHKRTSLLSRYEGRPSLQAGNFPSMTRRAFPPTIGLTMGDPAGVGPELVLRALQSKELAEKLQLVVLGSRVVLEKQIAFAGSETPPLEFVSLQDFQRGQETPSTTCRFIDVPTVNLEGIETCQVSSACGKASYDFIQAAIDLALDGTIDAVTTCPINKAALSAAGLEYPGHTEMFAERCHDKEAADRWCMMQFSDEITCTFATTHVGYCEVPQLLTRDRVRDTISLTAQAMRRIHGQEPHLVVCGLNPHAGEGGLFGNREEEAIIIPAIEELRSEGLQIVGPVPGDTAFLPWRRAQTDAFICMYHDQGHIPVKALAFDKAVNTSLGLRVIRTSVDHGTAFDIAWKKPSESDRRPDPGSLFAALNLAASLAR